MKCASNKQQIKSRKLINVQQRLTTQSDGRTIKSADSLFSSLLKIDWNGLKNYPVLKCSKMHTFVVSVPCAIRQRAALRARENICLQKTARRVIYSKLLSPSRFHLFFLLQIYIFALEIFIDLLLHITCSVLFTRKIQIYLGIVYVVWYTVYRTAPHRTVSQLWWMKPAWGYEEIRSRKRFIAICERVRAAWYTCDMAQICIYFYLIDSQW